MAGKERRGAAAAVAAAAAKVPPPPLPLPPSLTVAQLPKLIRPTGRRFQAARGADPAVQARTQFKEHPRRMMEMVLQGARLPENLLQSREGPASWTPAFPRSIWDFTLLSREEEHFDDPRHPIHVDSGDAAALAAQAAAEIHLDDQAGLGTTDVEPPREVTPDFQLAEAVSHILSDRCTRRSVAGCSKDSCAQGDAELLDAEQLHKLTSRASVSMALHASHGGKGRCSLTGLGVLPLLLWIESVTSTSTLRPPPADWSKAWLSSSSAGTSRLFPGFRGVEEFAASTYVFDVRTHGQANTTGLRGSRVTSPFIQAFKLIVVADGRKLYCRCSHGRTSAPGEGEKTRHVLQDTQTLRDMPVVMLKVIVKESGEQAETARYALDDLSSKFQSSTDVEKGSEILTMEVRDQAIDSPVLALHLNLNNRPSRSWWRKRRRRPPLKASGRTDYLARCLAKVRLKSRGQKGH
ncbi:hypothetical protein AK812_SmicGene37730 [Symbiodinium microadriaticum]|uniref:Uncharacterized protein n=1 Tax=Symbiodinium microadriaticum TaxID=2951 RepID=A0A1Q9CFJ9_SYMMI|nr:hypothetical protein AK812_SmicGene37730 [Symbiodinium microadriaticum]